jgi:DNA replication protein DnaC
MKVNVKGKLSEKFSLTNVGFLESDTLEYINFMVLKSWLNKGLGFESLIVVGPSGVGKTLLSQSICNMYLERCEELNIAGGDYLYITQLDGLKRYDPSIHKILVLDDLPNLSSLDRTTRIHLICSSSENVDIRCRFTNATIAPLTPRIFTLNDIVELFPKP